MALVPEHNLPGLVHAHHMASRVAPGHGVDSSAEETEGRIQGRRELALPLLTGPGLSEALSEPITSPVKWALRAVVGVDPSAHGKAL